MIVARLKREAGNLDLRISVIAEGRRIEPQPGEVIRMAGNYDRGRCLGTGVTPRQG